MQIYKDILNKRKKKKLKIKSVSKETRNTLLQTEYFYTKKPDINSILEFNPEVIDRPD
jgi:hypothetical protein